MNSVFSMVNKKDFMIIQGILSEKALFSKRHYMQSHFNDPIAAKLSNKLCIYGLWTNSLG